MSKHYFSLVVSVMCAQGTLHAQALPVTEQTRFVDGQTVITKTVAEPNKGNVTSSEQDIEQRYLSVLPESEKLRGQDYLRLNRDLENAQIRLRLAEYKKQAIDYENELNRTQQRVDQQTQPALGNVNIVGASSSATPRVSPIQSEPSFDTQILDEKKQNFLEKLKVLGIFRDHRSGTGDYVAELQVDDQRLEVSGQSTVLDDIQVTVNKRFVAIKFAHSSDTLNVYPEGS